MKELTDKQKNFCLEYLKDFNATQAAIRAGYSTKTAKVIGCQNLTKLNISKELRKLSEKLTRGAELTIARVIEEKQYIAFSDIGELFTEDGELIEPHELPEEVRRAISSIDVNERWEKDRDDEPIKVITYKYRFWNKIQALELLGRYLSMYAGKGDAPTVIFLGAEEIEKPNNAGM